MGLDSYWHIRKTTYEFGWKSDGEEALKKVLGKYPKEVRDINRKTGGCPALGPSIRREETYEIGYFRKFDAMHRWVIRHCADGKDDCQDIMVSDERLDELIDACMEVLLASVAAKAPAEGLSEEEAKERLEETVREYLPPTPGVSDEGYLKKASELLELLRGAKKALEKLRAKAEASYGKTGNRETWELVYEASW